ncbi:hypothetical protein [Paenibacillus thiaminolyticus]|uniref:hypothetical protein n=1 Tax=Paenibacillus thiaminolyticus TaxID=49283 RepID=UPI0025438756|nr:hypothetical protein [Paenibacillus thiaminolyticus]WII40173.1 hypothetical protein O0V01_14275 [Paenibacillus thiaminolyticus]
MISYWKGAAVQLRAPDTENIHVFESLDDAILQSHDSIAFPRTKAQIEEWMEQILQGAMRRMIYTGGQYYDEVYFGMTKEEFQELYPQ